MIISMTNDYPQRYIYTERERESNSEEKRLFAFSTLFCRRFHSETDQNGMWWPCGRNGGSSFSSSSTAEQVTEGIDGTGLTAIVTGHFLFSKI